MKFQEIQRRFGMGNRGGNTNLYVSVTTAVPQALVAIVNPYENHGSLGVNRAMPLSVDAAVPRPQEPLQNLRKTMIH